MDNDFHLIYDGQRVTPIIQKLKDLKVAFDAYERVDTETAEKKIIMVYSINTFLKDAIRTLETNLNNIRQNNCRDAIPRNIKEMTKVAYWLEDDNRLEQEMYAFAEKPLSSYDLDFIPKHKDTIELYKVIVELIKRLIELLLEMDTAVKAADETELYLSLYRNLRAQYCEDQAVNDFEELMSNSGKIDFYKMKTLQMQVIANFINGGTLNCAPPTTDLERENLTFDKEKSFMPHEYQYKQWFLDGWAVLNRSISWRGDIVVPDYSCVGLFISQRWEQLTERNLKDIFYLDKMLDLIHKKMVEMAPAPERVGKLEDRIKKCIAQLMTERYGDEPLFNIQGHWQAVYRILVDKGYCRDSDFNGFDAFIQEVMPEKVNKPYKRDSVRNINKTDFNKPFDKWKYNAETSGKRIPYDRMMAVASRFKAILEENGL